jgi:signal transduction histidine kinase/ABC-type multidrug transport system ATPase subunit
MTAVAASVAGTAAGPVAGAAAAGAGPDGAQSGPIVSVSGLKVNFGQVRALAGVDLAIGAGEVVALAGENGAGKTTLVRCIAGDIAPTSGQILLSGRPLPAGPLAVARRGVGVVWQDLSLCDNLDIASNLLLGRERRHQLRSDVRLHADASAVLSRLGIALSDTTRSVGSLSGGQRQLVAIARAMAGEPALLLLDEPTASLGVRQAGQVEDLIAALRARGTSVVIACHDVDMMCRLADRIVVLRHGKVAADVDPRTVHPDEVVALLSGQELDSSARRQLTRLQGLAGRLVSADPSSSLSLILSALGAALGSERLCIHLAADQELVCAMSLGLPVPLLDAWSRLALGPAGGPPGMAAATAWPFIVEDVSSSPAWTSCAPLAAAAGIASSWSVPVLTPGGLAGVITVLDDVAGQPERDQLELVTVYAGYAASAIERDRLLDEVTARNRVLETIREVLETLAGPIQVSHGLGLALTSLCRGLQATDVALITWPRDGGCQCRGFVTTDSADGLAGGSADGPVPAPPAVISRAEQALANRRADGAALGLPGGDGRWHLAVTFAAPAGPSVLLASFDQGPPAQEAITLLEDAAHSLRLALEREEAGLAHQEATALRRSQELQRDFLSRLSHELRTPLTAIRGYASSLLQPDVTWDAASQQRFLARIAAESARLGRLVDDLLDFSAIELGIMRLQPDWCDIGLVLEAAAACLPPADASMIEISCAPRLPVIWADHDRLEQVFVNLLGNAIGHNPPGTEVTVTAEFGGPASVAITVTDDGAGMPAELTMTVFEPRRRRRTRTAGAGIGLSIARGIVAAHGGTIELGQPVTGTSFVVRLPVEETAVPAGSSAVPAGNTAVPAETDAVPPDGEPHQRVMARARLRRGAWSA